MTAFQFLFSAACSFYPSFFPSHSQGIVDDDDDERDEAPLSKLMAVASASTASVKSPESEVALKAFDELADRKMLSPLRSGIVCFDTTRQKD